MNGVIGSERTQINFRRGRNSYQPPNEVTDRRRPLHVISYPKYGEPVAKRTNRHGAPALSAGERQRCKQRLASIQAVPEDEYGTRQNAIRLTSAVSVTLNRARRWAYGNLPH
jgi:hypothetical protein